MDNTLFNKHNIVRHKATGNLYLIIDVPHRDKRLEYCHQPYYAYEKIGERDNITWIRSMSEMEDGRFELM